MDGFHEAIPVWERTYAVTETKRCVEGAAGTRGADETITEGLFVELPVNWIEVKVQKRRNNACQK